MKKGEEGKYRKANGEREGSGGGRAKGRFLEEEREGEMGKKEGGRERGKNDDHLVRLGIGKGIRDLQKKRAVLQITFAFMQ
jgi:hypothetical protein